MAENDRGDGARQRNQSHLDKTLRLIGQGGTQAEGGGGGGVKSLGCLAG